MSSKHEIIIYWSDEDASFVAEVPKLPGCMTDGKSYQETVSNAEIVIKEWIETAKELGRPIPQPLDVCLTFKPMLPAFDSLPLRREGSKRSAANDSRITVNGPWITTLIMTINNHDQTQI